MLSSLRKTSIIRCKTLPFFHNKAAIKSVVHLSTSGDSGTNPEEKDDKTNKVSTVMSKIHYFINKNTQPVAIGASVLVAAGITRGLYGLTYSFLSLTPYQSMYYGFIGGILATGTVAGMLYTADRSFHINPDRAVSAGMSIIHQNSEIKSILGTNLHKSNIKTYSSTSGGFGIRNARPTWVSPEIQVVFTVQGSAGEALVSVVYAKKGAFGKEVLDFVGLEWIDKRGGGPVTLTLKGDSDRFTVKNQLKPHGVYLGKKYLL